MKPKNVAAMEVFLCKFLLITAEVKETEEKFLNLKRTYERGIITGKEYSDRLFFGFILPLFNSFEESFKELIHAIREEEK